MPADATGNITIKAVEPTPTPQPWLWLALLAAGGITVVYFVTR